ncbi:MAG: hypothetical protein HFG22_18515 [Lachnospiraceae bacterium]|nr:hypothetical protein [Lachnospiraceae bacterium]
MIEKKEHFPAEDGHIESILIGVGQVKVSFQTWDARKFVLIFENVERIVSTHAVYGDISRYEVLSGSDKGTRYIFYSTWHDEDQEEKGVLWIDAEKMEIFQVGIEAELNAAIFDVGYGYVGGQKCPYHG